VYIELLLQRLTAMGGPALLTAVNSTSHVHLVVGCNPLAGSRLAKSLEVGAKPILISPDNGNIHYGITKRIEENGLQWITRDFQDEDLERLGRDAVCHIVDAVFVTLGAKNPLSRLVKVRIVN
jgi:uroporphyrin-III C-methyltransferase